MALTRDELAEVVRTSDKQRYSFDSTGLRIRANQGHSVAVDLHLEPAEPPAELFHGTSAHLSEDADTARRVGARHGTPVVLRVDARAMAAAGLIFFRSDNGVWLTDGVPAAYLGRT
jgi:putative RNA 2'-phosphotransferase